MTNSKTITPFCVDMSNATEQEIRDLHKMCVDAGASDYENSSSWFNNRSWYNYMGIDDDGEIIALDGTTDYQDNIIPLEEVPSHLGLSLPEDKTLVEGSLEHAYIELKGDLNNCLGGFSNTQEYLVYGDNNYFTFDKKPQFNRIKEVCTIKEFQEYCEQQSYVSTQTCLNQPVTGFTTEPNESHTESVKPLKWTEECQSQGIPFQVGMQVSIDSANVQGDFNVVTAIGEEFVLLKVDNTEKCVRKEEVLPYKEVVVSQRDKVINVILDGLVYSRNAESVYDDLLSMGVLKEEV